MDDLVECTGIARGWWVPAKNSERACACITTAIEDREAADSLIRLRRQARLTSIDPRDIHDHVALEVVECHQAEA